MKHATPANHWSWRIPVRHRQGTRHGRLMFVGAQADLDAAGNVNHAGDRLRQADACMQHVAAVLEALGGRVQDIVKLNVFYAAGTLDDELALLVVHGVLHILGYDHAEPHEETAMQARERALLAAHHQSVTS